MHSTLLLVFLFIHSTVFSQYKIEIEIKSLPSYHQKGSAVYIAGSFNNWNPGDERYKMSYEDGEYEIKFNLPHGAYEFKFTRGSWEKVETTAEGHGVNNRELVVTANKELDVSIAGWQDHFPPAPKISTASPQVKVLDSAYYIPQLNRYRRVWIYLPKDYSNNKRYPVLYMHDGQNIFDNATSFSGEWGVDEFLDTTSLAKAIVVAIDHGGQYRLNEYSPYDMDRYGRGQGKKYVDFVVKNLKPYIDKKFRTYKDRQHTFIAGSSMGGLISMYAILKYPNVFGGAGVFSPSFWVAPAINDLVEKNAKKLKGKVFFYAGTSESETMVSDMQKVAGRLGSISTAKILVMVGENGTHSETVWRGVFGRFYRWLVSNE